MTFSGVALDPQIVVIDILGFKSRLSAMSANESTQPTSASRRELAVARVLDPARERAETRVQAFLDAALELMNASTSGQEFTVQEVIERSGQSLRSFYQYFDGKHELLLALFEDSVRTTSVLLREAVEQESSPLAKLHRFAIDYYHECQPTPKPKAPKRFAPAYANFANQLLTEHPQEASRAFSPLIALLEELLGAAAADGSIREGLHHNRIAGVILQAIMFNAYAATISAVPVHPNNDDPAEELWDLLIHGLAT